MGISHLDPILPRRGARVRPDSRRSGGRVPPGPVQLPGREQHGRAVQRRGPGPFVGTRLHRHPQQPARDGDLHVSGQQVINVAGDHTKISLKGRVRPEDIVSGNQVLSTRLADATINYDGTGLVSRGAKPGPINRVLNWLGLL